MANHTYYKTYSYLYDNLIVDIKNIIKKLPEGVNDDTIKFCCDQISQMLLIFKEKDDLENVKIVCSCLIVYVLAFMLKKYGLRIFRIILCSIPSNDIVYMISLFLYEDINIFNFTQEYPIFFFYEEYKAEKDQEFPFSNFLELRFLQKAFNDLMELLLPHISSEFFDSKYTFQVFIKFIKNYIIYLVSNSISNMDVINYKLASFLIQGCFLRNTDISDIIQEVGPVNTVTAFSNFVFESIFKFTNKLKFYLNFEDEQFEFMDYLQSEKILKIQLIKNSINFVCSPYIRDHLFLAGYSFDKDKSQITMSSLHQSKYPQTNILEVYIILSRLYREENFNSYNSVLVPCVYYLLSSAKSYDVVNLQKCVWNYAFFQIINILFDELKDYALHNIEYMHVLITTYKSLNGYESKSIDSQKIDSYFLSCLFYYQYKLKYKHSNTDLYEKRKDYFKVDLLNDTLLDMFLVLISDMTGSEIKITFNSLYAIFGMIMKSLVFMSRVEQYVFFKFLSIVSKSYSDLIKKDKKLMEMVSYIHEQYIFHYKSKCILVSTSSFDVVHSCIKELLIISNELNLFKNMQIMQEFSYSKYNYLIYSDEDILCSLKNLVQKDIISNMEYHGLYLKEKFVKIKAQMNKDDKEDNNKDIYNQVKVTNHYYNYEKVFNFVQFKTIENEIIDYIKSNDYEIFEMFVLLDGGIYSDELIFLILLRYFQKYLKNEEEGKSMDDTILKLINFFLNNTLMMPVFAIVKFIFSIEESLFSKIKFLLKSSDSYITEYIFNEKVPEEVLEKVSMSKDNHILTQLRKSSNFLKRIYNEIYDQRLNLNELLYDNGLYVFSMRLIDTVYYYRLNREGIRDIYDFTQTSNLKFLYNMNLFSISDGYKYQTNKCLNFSNKNDSSLKILEDNLFDYEPPNNLIKNEDLLHEKIKIFFKKLIFRKNYNSEELLVSLYLDVELNLDVKNLVRIKFEAFSKLTYLILNQLPSISTKKDLDSLIVRITSDRRVENIFTLLYLRKYLIDNEDKVERIIDISIIIVQVYIENRYRINDFQKILNVLCKYLVTRLSPETKNYADYFDKVVRIFIKGIYIYNDFNSNTVIEDTQEEYELLTTYYNKYIKNNENRQFNYVDINYMLLLSNLKNK